MSSFRARRGGGGSVRRAQELAGPESTQDRIASQATAERTCASISPLAATTLPCADNKTRRATRVRPVASKPDRTVLGDRSSTSVRRARTRSRPARRKDTLLFVQHRSKETKIYVYIFMYAYRLRPSVNVCGLFCKTRHPAGKSRFLTSKYRIVAGRMRTRMRAPVDRAIVRSPTSCRCFCCY